MTVAWLVLEAVARVAGWFVVLMLAALHYRQRPQD